MEFFVTHWCNYHYRPSRFRFWFVDRRRGLVCRLMTSRTSPTQYGPMIDWLSSIMRKVYSLAVLIIIWFNKSCCHAFSRLGPTILVQLAVHRVLYLSLKLDLQFTAFPSRSFEFFLKSPRSASPANAFCKKTSTFFFLISLLPIRANL